MENGVYVHIIESTQGNKRYIVEDSTGEMHVYRTWDEAVDAGKFEVAELAA